MINELDAAFDAADADDDVRVVVLAADGKHFSAGHDLKELLAGEEYWSALRDTPEGKLRHEQVMYFDKLVRIRDFRKPTIAAVQGTCAAAGLMLACIYKYAVSWIRCSDQVAAKGHVMEDRLRQAGVELLYLSEPPPPEQAWVEQHPEVFTLWKHGEAHRIYALR